MPDPQYNLVLMHFPGFQHVGDFQTIRNILIGIAPQIRTIIASRGEQGIKLPPHASSMIAALPTLIFSPTPLDLPKEFRGTRMICKRSTKVLEYEMMQAAGVPFPKTTPIRHLDQLADLDLGDHFVIKPNIGKQGKNVMLVSAESAPSVIAGIWPDDPLDLIAQQYVNTGASYKSYRCLTVLSEVIYCCEKSSAAAKQQEELDAKGFSGIASNAGQRHMVLSDNERLITFAEETAQKLANLPVMGLDLIEDANDGTIYCVELNSGGWTWHLSSGYGRQYREEFRLDYYGQRHGLHRIAKRLAELVPQEAT